MRDFSLKTLSLCFLWSAVITIFGQVFFPEVVNGADTLASLLVLSGSMGLVALMGWLSLWLFHKVGPVGAGHWILASIPVLNVLIATWMFLSIRDPIEIARTTTVKPVQHSMAVSAAEMGKVLE